MQGDCLNISKKPENEFQSANVKKVAGNAYVANPWSREVLVGWHLKTFCDRDKFVASGLKLLNNIGYDLVAAKTNASEGVIYLVDSHFTYAVVSVMRNRRRNIFY